MVVLNYYDQGHRKHLKGGRGQVLKGGHYHTHFGLKGALLHSLLNSGGQWPLCPPSSYVPDYDKFEHTECKNVRGRIVTNFPDSYMNYEKSDRSITVIGMLHNEDFQILANETPN